ncbi:protein PFC0760c-like [Ruditapes philippinarum]|uniref:protein PFC0760c-like n=1 Tax=Ruditapes philippinarum TaxID=129788 RepID=UPI00295A718D|nr:protein PFC0760c-like [Ruditapes philippinarum]
MVILEKRESSILYQLFFCSPQTHENDSEDQSRPEAVETFKPDLQDSQIMAPQKKSRINRPFFVAFFLVIIIVVIYTMSSRPNKDLTERMHNDWVKTMTKDVSVQNDSVGLRHFERHEVTRLSQETGSQDKRVSMILPAEIPEDLHKAQTQGVPIQYGSDQNTGVSNTNITVQRSEIAQNKLIDMRLDDKESDGNNIELPNDAYKGNIKENGEHYEDDDDDNDSDDEYDDDNDDYDDKHIIEKDTADNTEQYTMNESQYNRENVVQTNLVNMHIEPDQQQANNFNPEQNNYVKPELEQANYVKSEQGQMNYVNPGQANYLNPGIENANYAKPEQAEQVQMNYAIQEQAKYPQQEPAQVNNINPEQVNYGNPINEQSNYAKPEQIQMNYANQEQANYPQQEPAQMNNINPEQVNYDNPINEQSNYAKPEQIQMNYANQEQANYPQQEPAQIININPEQVNYGNPIIEQANNVKPELVQMNYANQEQANYAQQEPAMLNNVNPYQNNYVQLEPVERKFINTEQENYAKQQLEQPSYVKQEQNGNAQQEIGQDNNVRTENSNYNKPLVGIIGDNNVPSYNAGFNNDHHYPGLSNNAVQGNVVSDTQGEIQNENGQIGNFLDTNRLSQTYDNGYGDSERNIGKQLFNIDKDVYHTMKQPSPYTLAPSIESRMKLHKILKDMHDIVDHGSAKSDEENKKQWKEGENKEHVYDLNNKVDMFGNLRMQVNLQAEPVTGTKPMRPPYKSSIQYPEYLTPINWETSFEHVKTPTFECVPMRTIDKYIRICVHPPKVRSQMSTKLKAEATWEYSALMDMQKALLQNKDAFLIDIGASFGVFSLAAAALNRNVIAVEPYSSHIQVLKQSVALNSFRNHITLFQAVISDRRGKVLIKPLEDNVDNVYIQTVEENEQATNYTLVVNTVTFDDIEKICPGRVAVLKIDIPGFEKRALEYSYFFFKYIYVTHVFMHWNTNDKGLCLFVTRFFVEKGYQPYSDLNGSTRLDIQTAASWTNDIVIWKL